jgi:DNA modification methylase
VSVNIIEGDCRDVLATLPDQSVHCCVTSPPYFGQRDYGVEDQIGRELSPNQHIAEMVSVFRKVRRVLRDDGTLWLNYADSWASKGWRAHSAKAGVPSGWDANRRGQDQVSTVGDGIKERDLNGMSWMLALALRDDGWFLRDCIIWAKPNPMPSSVPNRTCPSHEYIFMLTKVGGGYYYDAEAINEPISDVSAARLAQPTLQDQQGGPKQSVYAAGETGQRAKSRKPADILKSLAANGNPMRKRRSVWTIPVGAFSEAHFATFPPDLIEPCIKAGCPIGGTVLDPFGGAGTTGLVADRLQRNAVLIELNPAYVDIARRRIEADCPLFVRGAA